MATTDSLQIVSLLSLEETTEVFVKNMGHLLNIKKEKSYSKRIITYVSIPECILFMTNYNNNEYYKARYGIEPTIELEIQYNRDFGIELASTNVLQAVLGMISSEEGFELAWEMYNSNETALVHCRDQLIINPEVSFWTNERLALIDREFVIDSFDEPQM